MVGGIETGGVIPQGTINQVIFLSVCNICLEFGIYSAFFGYGFIVSPDGDEHTV